MEEIRVKHLQKLQKRTDSIIEDLKLLRDAQAHIMDKTGEDAGVVMQIKIAIEDLQMASYSLALATVSAEGKEITGQMQTDFDALARLNGEAED